MNASDLRIGPRTVLPGRRPRASLLLSLPGGIALLAVIPLMLPQYLQGLATEALIYCIFAISLDLLLGYAGMTSLGHAAFLGIGGYTAAVLMVREGYTSAWVGLLAAVLVAGAGAAIGGIIALRTSGVYFLLVTFALAQLAYSVAQKWSFLTVGGAEGIAGISYPSLTPFTFTWNSLTFYEFTLVLFAVSYWLLRKIVRSPFGVTLSAIRQNEQRMQALGYNTWLYKYLAFVIAGMLAGGAGALLAYQSGIVVPDNLNVLTSGTVVFMVLVGGARTLYGPVMGAIIISIIQYYGTLYLPSTGPLILGSVFVVVVMFARDGIAGGIKRINAAAKRRGSAHA